jgi:hypothetical protein
MEDGLVDAMIGREFRTITNDFPINDHKLMFGVFIDSNIILGMFWSI